MQSIVNLPVIGLDLAKSVFQLHIVDIESGEIQRRQIKRAKLTEFFVNCQPSLVAMEAYGATRPMQWMLRRYGWQRSSHTSCPCLSRRSASKPAWPFTACAANS